MGVREFFFLFEPFWFVFVTPFIAFIVGTIVLSVLFKRKIILKDLEIFPFWMRVVISFVASGFVIVPFLAFNSLYNKYHDSDTIVIRLIDGYAEGVYKIFDFFGKFVPNSWKDISESPINIIFIIGFGAIYMSVLFAPVLFATTGGLLLMFKRYTWKQKLKITAVTFVMGVLCSAFSISSALWLYDRLEEFNNTCSSKVGEVYNFRTHLEDLCNNRPTFAECPKNEQELRAFNPEAYDSMEECTDSEYFFSEKYGHQWLMKENLFDYYSRTQHQLVPPKESRYTPYSKQDLKKLRQQYAE